MARPLKGKEPLGKPIAIRLSASDRAVYDAKVAASGMNQAEFFRDVVLKNKTRITALPVMDNDKRKLLRYFQSTSNNMNQLAKRANLENKKGSLSDETYVEVLKSLRQIELMLKQVL